MLEYLWSEPVGMIATDLLDPEGPQDQMPSKTVALSRTEYLVASAIMNLTPFPQRWIVVIRRSESSLPFLLELPMN